MSSNFNAPRLLEYLNITNSKDLKVNIYLTSVGAGALVSVADTTALITGAQFDRFRPPPEFDEEFDGPEGGSTSMLLSLCKDITQIT